MFDPREQAIAFAAPTPDTTQTAPRARRPRLSPRWRSAALTGSALGGLWLVLSGFDAGSLLFGLPAIAAGAALGYHLPPASAWRIRPVPALRFCAFFARQSVRGALDVARRVLDPRLPLAPGFRTVILRIGPGPGRVLVANTISLLPGTLSAEIDGPRLVVHTLDLEVDLAAEVAAIEARIRAIFGETA